MDSGVDGQGGICITDVHHDAPLFLSFSLSVFKSFILSSQQRGNLGSVDDQSLVRLESPAAV